MPKEIPEDIKRILEVLRDLLKDSVAQNANSNSDDEDSGEYFLTNQTDAWEYFNRLTPDQQKSFAYYYPHDIAIAYCYPKLQEQIAELNNKHAAEFAAKRNDERQIAEQQAQLAPLEVFFLQGLIKKINSRPTDVQEIINFVQVNTEGEKPLIDLNRLHIILNKPDLKGMTALMHAVNTDDNNLIEYLLSLKIDPNIQNADGNTALHLAAKGEYSHAFYALFHHVDKENPENSTKISLPNNKGTTAARMTQDAKDQQMYNFVITNKVTKLSDELIALLKNNTGEFETKLIELLCSDPKDYSISDVINAISEKYNRTLLMICAETGELELVKFLIENHALYNESTALKTAFLAAAMGDYVDVMEYVVSKGVDKNVTDAGGNNSLIVAARSGADMVVEWLVDEIKMKVDFKGDHNFTALQHAVIRNYEDICEFLYSRGANIKTRNTYGYSALSYALLYGLHNTVNIFATGMDKGIKGLGYTDLMMSILQNRFLEAANHIHFIVEDKDFNTLNAITDGGLNAVTDGGFSALMMAAQSLGSMKRNQNLKPTLLALILEMIKAGADVNFTNKMHINFFTLLYENKNQLDDKFMLELFKQTTTEEFIKSHNGQNIFHLCMANGANFVNDFLSLAIKFNIDRSVITKLLNTKDDSGNTPLSYLLYDTKHAFDAKTIFKLVDQFDAQFTRNGNETNNKETKTQLHLKVILLDHNVLGLKDHEAFSNISPQDLSNLFTNSDLQNINAKDEQHGRTPLHEAFIRDKTTLAEFFLINGADPKLKDRAGRTPLHYAAISKQLPIMYGFNNGGDVEIQLKGLGIEDFYEPDKFGITPLLLAFQVETDKSYLKDLEDFIKAGPKTNISDILLKIGTNTLEENINLIKNLDNKEWFITGKYDYKLKLALLSALGNYYKVIDEDVDRVKAEVDKAAKETIEQEFGNAAKYPTGNFPPGHTFGIESELPGLVDVTIVPTAQLVEWFGSVLVSDATVHPTILGPYARADTRDKLELVSPIIRSYNDLEKFLAICQILEDCGVTTNPSGSIHNHFGTNAAPDAKPSVAAFIEPENLLDYAKYVILNYISIEQLLRSVVRGGNSFPDIGEVYVNTISRFADEVGKATTMEQLKEICSHSSTVDLTALDRHQTIEFRISEGSLNRWFIYAWADCLRRLTLISKEQAESHERGKATNPREDIEQLFYILIAMRNYNESWDKEWGAVASSDFRNPEKYPGKDPRPAQVQIQEAPFYNMLRMIIYGKDNHDIEEKIRAYLDNEVTNSIFLKREENKADVLAQVLKTTEFLLKAPGLQQHNINADTIKFLKELKELEESNKPMFKS